MSSPEGPPHFPGEHYRTLYTAVSLFTTLYLPEDGVEDVPVGDELLEWLNTHFIEPSTEEGGQLSALQNPWEDDLFWPYLIRYCAGQLPQRCIQYLRAGSSATLRCLMKSSVFFLKTLKRLPSENLRRISEQLTALLEKHPR